VKLVEEVEDWWEQLKEEKEREQLTFLARGYNFGLVTFC